MLTIALTAAGSITTAIIVAIVTYALTRRREHEAEWRKLKFSQYQELLLALSGIVEDRATPEAHVRYADACNSLNLAASWRVLRALRDFQAYTRGEREAKNLDAHDRFLSVLVREMRADLFTKGTTDVRDFQFRLITTPPPR